MPSVSLAARLLVAFGLLTVASTATVGLLVRDALRTSESDRFASQVQGARAGIELELSAEQAAITDLLRPLCEHDAFVDKALVDLEANRLDSARRLAIAQLVPDEMKALRLNELVLVTGAGEVLGAGHDPSLVGVKSPALAQQLSSPESAFATLRAPSAAGASGKAHPAALLGRCTRKAGGTQVGLIGARNLTHLLDRMSQAYGVRLAVAGSPEATARPQEITTQVQVDKRSGLKLIVAKSRKDLDQALAQLDQLLLMTGGFTLLAAIVLAFILARSMAKPLSLLAREVREVVGGEPHEVRVRGTSEMRQLAQAFNKTLHDLAVLRRRQAAVERIAAWREVARRVAHEIKNPLTPIRSSIETLRRLKDRSDPKFDEYFEEATKGILEEVHRIASIASDFARFARLPSPKPAPLDVIEVARTVVSMHAGGQVQVELVSSPCPSLNADRDQLVQMLTNLVQNAMDAVREASPEPKVEVLLEPCRGDHIRLAVRDNGPGLPQELLTRLFEPYVTTKAHGTGLGLPIVHRIVVEHGGEISYSPSPSGGACFSVLLPCAGPSTLPDPEPTPISG